MTDTVELTPCDRVLTTPELRDMVFRYICSPRTFCILRAVSKLFSAVYQCAMISLYSPTLFAKFFFADPVHAIAVIRDTRAVLAGISVRQYLYNLDVRDGLLIVLVNEDALDDVLSFIVRDGYDSLAVEQPATSRGRARLCRRPTEYYEFACKDGRGERRISVRAVLHDPLRVLFSSYGMHGCDGWRFFDMYPRLGPTPNPQRRVRGRQPYLLTARESKVHLPLEAYSNDEDAMASPLTVFLERWLGDSNTWLLPNVDNYSGPRLEDHGWTIRLHVRRVLGTPHIHFWTDTACRCLSHDLLQHTYVAPPPATAYAKRVLDRLNNTLASGVGFPLLGPGRNIISSFDDELDEIFDCFQCGRDYTFYVVGYVFSVSRLYCTYEELGSQ